jgi:hypothetical protein
MGKKQLSTHLITKIQGYGFALSGKIPRPSRKFLCGMMLGLVMADCVFLSEIARELHHFRDITFHALHKGLCQNLKSPQWAVGPVQEAYLKHVSSTLKNDAVIACDLGDITKPSARKMPGLKTVRDGSTGELRKGWWLMEIEAVMGKKHVPLWLELFSVGRRPYKSTWMAIEAAVVSVVKQLGNKGRWVFDRGFDNQRFFRFLSSLQLRFLIRVNANRRVNDLDDGEPASMGRIAQKALGRAPFLWRRRAHTRLLWVGLRRIELPQIGEFTLVAVRGFGRNPLLLLTNETIPTAQEAVAWVRLYLKRWGVEEAGRLVKQVFKLEDLRVLSWNGLVRLVWCAMWAYGFLCLLRFQGQRFYRAVLSSYPSFGDVPVFPYYRLAAAVAALLLPTMLSPSASRKLWV